jgi:hypothetical protein
MNGCLSPGASEVRSEGGCWEIDTRHDLVITEPEAFVGFLRNIAGTICLRCCS